MVTWDRSERSGQCLFSMDPCCGWCSTLSLSFEASDFLRALHGAGRSPITIRVYAGRVAGFLGWCTSQGIDWSSISVPALARFTHFIEATPDRRGQRRAGPTVNATLTAV